MPIDLFELNEMKKFPFHHNEGKFLHDPGLFQRYEIESAIRLRVNNLFVKKKESRIWITDQIYLEFILKINHKNIINNERYIYIFYR